MTDPWSELDAYRADATRLARPIPLAELRRRARRRRGRQIAGVVGAVALIIGGVGVGVGYGASQRRAEPGPATQHTTAPSPTSSSSTPTTPTGQTRPTTPTTSTPTGTFPQSSRHYDEIPADYPWLSYVFVDTARDGHVDGPGGGVRGPTLAPCRHRTWEPNDPIARRGIFSHFIEGGEFRQVLLFPSANAAQQALDAVRTAYTQCPIQRSSHGWAVRFVVTTSASHAALAVSAQSEQQGHPALGLEELRWVRIANAVIYTWDTHDSVGNDPLPGRHADRLLTQMVSAWCDLAGGC